MNKKTALISTIVIILLLVIGGVAYMMLQDKDAGPTTNDNSNSETMLYNKNANKNSNKNTNANKNANSNTNKNLNTDDQTDEEEDADDTSNSNANANSNSNTNSNSNKNTNATTSAAGETYKNERYGFSVDVPKTMEFLSDKEEAGYYPFGETEMKDEDGYEGEWFVSVYSSKKKEDLITEHKDSLQEAEAKTEEVTLSGGEKATKATISGSNRRTPIVAVYVEKNGRTFEILGNNDSEFEAFYKSFDF